MKKPILFLFVCLLTSSFCFGEEEEESSNEEISAIDGPTFSE